MSPSPDPQVTGSSPFVPTDTVDSNSFSSLFGTKSEMGDRPGPTGDGSRMSSMIASIMSAPRAADSTFSTSTLTSDSQSATSSITGSSSSHAQTAVATATQSVTASTTPEVSNAAGTSSSDAQSQAAMSKPGNQAAVAVPIVVVLIAIVALTFFCMKRRKKRRSQGVDTSAEKEVAAKNKKWTRHLRIFSFDNELLMGGRYSSTNSIRSRQTGSVRSNDRTHHLSTPSVRSVEDVAPAYRDAVHTTQPSIGPVVAGVAGVGRSESTATAPPPYAGQPISPETRTTRSQNPFADSPFVSPIEGESSPFNDPPGLTPVISRTSSLQRGGRDDASSIAASDAASIRQATLARNASVISGGRVIQNVRHDSR